MYIIKLFVFCLVVHIALSSSLHKLKRLLRQTDEEGNCRLPPTPANGYWTLLSSPSPSAAASILTVKCDKGYFYDGISYNIFCNKGKWNAEIGNCRRMCKPLVNDSNTNIACQRDGVEIDCKKPFAGTIARFHCPTFYELKTNYNTIICIDGAWDLTPPQCQLASCESLQNIPSSHVTCTREGLEVDCNEILTGTVATFHCPHYYELNYNYTIVSCFNGLWSRKVPRCQAVCGKITDKDINGDTIIPNRFPWYAALYKKEDLQFLSGGTLISPTIIITAAHVVTDLNTKKANPPSMYLVTVGKKYLGFSNYESTAQNSEIKEIYVPATFRAFASDYESDIAVLVTKTPFTMNVFVQPACLNLNPKSEVIPANRLGYVPTWLLFNSTIDVNKIVSNIPVSYVDNSTCSKNVPDSFQRFLTYDKFCGVSQSDGKILCSGDGGGGFVQLSPNDDKFYLHGIVSSSPVGQNNRCFSKYTVFTQIDKYAKFIEDIVFKT